MKILKLAALSLFAFFANTSVQAETVTEDFESVTLTDTDSWGYGKGLSNGWKIVGGTIYTSAGSTNYGLWSTAYNGSKKSLEASYSSTNSAIVVIPTQLTGTFSFYARKTSSSSSTKGYVDLYEVEADGDSYKKVSSSSFKYWTLTSTTWEECTVDLGSEPRLIAICLSRAAIDDVVFNTYEQAAGPRLSVLKDGANVKNGSTFNFGLSAGETSTEYTVKNSGTETMTATIACEGDYTASESTISLKADEEKTITISQNAETYGAKNGTLTITPEGLDAFTLSLSGIVRDPAKLYLDFNEAPEDWTIDTENWTIADGCAKIGYYSSYSGNGRIASPLINVTEDDVLYIRYSKNTTSTYSSAYFNIYTSEDGKTWTKFGDKYGSDAEYEVWKETTISDFPTSAHYIALAGQYIALDDFYGFSLVEGPVMTIAGPGVAEGNVITDNFGFMKENGAHEYTISNIGTGELNIDITTSAPEYFTVSETAMTIAAGESKTLTVNYIFDEEYGKKEGTISIQPKEEGVDAVSINVTAIAQDPDTFEEDFENGIPALWTNNGWTVENKPSYGNGTQMAYAGRYSADNTLTTPRLMANEGDIIELEALLPWDDETLTMEYSVDNGETWEVAFSETPAANNTLAVLTWTAPADGYYYLRFSGRYNYIDNIRGFKYAPTELAESQLSLANHWSTLCYPADVTLPEGIQAFTAESVENGYIMLAEVEGTIPAFEPVLIYSEEGTPLTLPATSFVTKEVAPIHGSEGNLFIGCTNSLRLNKNTQFILQNQDDVLAFYRVNPAKPITTKAYRSYLELPEVSESKLIMNTEKPEETSIAKIEGTNTNVVYDLNGRKVQKLEKGVVYIIGNKKIMVK